MFCPSAVARSALEKAIGEGENPVLWPPVGEVPQCFDESGCLGMQPKRGGRHHLKLNTDTKPIANKYREGKMKSTLERG